LYTGPVESVGDIKPDTLTRNKHVTRNHGKSKAIMGNTRRMVDLEEKHHSLGSYLPAHRAPMA